MINLLPNLPAGVVGIIASGEVTANDYESVIIPAVEGALKEHDKVRFLYQLGPDFTGFTAGALWDDMKVGMAHFKAWERIAIVTDVDWVAGTIRFFRFAMPCPVKIFPNSQFDEAVKWLA